MVLGAGLFQLSGIARAVDLGLEVITVDNRPMNAGHRLAHQTVSMSTTDVQSVATLAQEMKADGVVTFSSDVSVEAAAAASGALGRRGPSPEVVGTLSNKARFRRFQAENNLPRPRFWVIPKGIDVPSRVSFGDGMSLVVKPSDASGSRGVTILQSPTPLRLRNAVSTARRSSRSGDVVIEEFLPGIEVGGDAFLLNGRIRRIFITSKRLDGVVVRGHCYPNANLNRLLSSELVEAIEQHCTAVGLRDGPLNFDVMLGGGPTVVIEMSPRTGGNGIPRLVNLVEGIDLEECAIRLALGQEPNLIGSADDQSRPPSAFSSVLTTPGPGTIRSITSSNNILASYPGIREAWLSARTGDVVQSSCGEPYGYLVWAGHQTVDEVAPWILDNPRFVRLEDD